jgi:DNA-directed RNA polymerase specialized sigma24 family protein
MLRAFPARIGFLPKSISEIPCEGERHHAICGLIEVVSVYATEVSANEVVVVRSSPLRVSTSAPEQESAAGDPLPTNEHPIDAESTTRLRRAFIARYGVALAEEVLAETMAWAWEHRTEVCEANNPLGLLYRVGQSKSRRFLRWRRPMLFPAHPGSEITAPEPLLGKAICALSKSQRVAVVLVHSYQWTYAEVAQTLGCSEAAVTNHVHRGLAKLRISLGVNK